MKNILSLLAVVAASFNFAQKVDMSVFGEMGPRQIGPAGMSGRVTCIDVIEDEPNTIYIGAASGGVWRSTNGGINWTPIADTLPTINIGALAIQQSNPDVIWVGTGEGNPRNSQNSGYGLYKTMDAGRSWECMGLEETRNIHRVIIHPDDPNTVWVGAQGPQWGDNPNRGVYKTTDGGKTWKHVLKGADGVGLADLVIDPSNPNKLIASMWEFRRQPWTFNSGGEGSGIYMSIDGGESWTEKTEEDGLPKGELGRIGLAISLSNPDRVYAIVEAEKNGFYRSDDGGYKWYNISTDKNAGDRPFYYSDIFVDPENENRIYSLWSRVSRSEDGGKTWKVIIPYYGVHPDHQAFWVHPKDPSYIIVGNDGGLAISRDKAQTWRNVKNLPLGQFYHIAVDDMLPYNIYGGMQDNGSWRGPGYVWGWRGIRNEHFTRLSGGDGFDAIPDPEEPERFGYSMSQRGYVGRYDLLTGYQKDIRPTTSDTIPLRFSWNAAIAQDPFDANTIYFGTQYVHKSTNEGDSWSIISPDLTTNDTSKQKQLYSGGLTFDVTGAENHTTILTINPSPVQKDLIWVGSDDGRLSLTTDGGATWSSLEGKLPDMPEGAWIPQIHPSDHNANEVFVVVNDYRRNDWKPYLYYSDNMGKSWKRIADENDFPGYCLSVIQDSKVPELLFAGTENGLYVSFDKGENWNHWTKNYPNVSTMDMKIQERESDLVLGTFGRSVYILDNIDPLRNMALNGEDKWKKDSLVLFEIPDAYMYESEQPIGLNFSANAVFSGANKGGGAQLYVYYNAGKDAKEKTEGKMYVMNEQGDTIRTRKIKVDNGVNRLGWGLDTRRNRPANTPKPAVKDKDKEFGGRPVLPGTYTVSIAIGNHESSQKVKVMYDPRLEVSIDDLKDQQARFDKVDALMAKVTDMCDELRANKASIKRVNQLMPTEKDSVHKKVAKLGKEAQKQIAEFMEKILGKEDVKGIFRNSEDLIKQVNEPLWHTWGNLSGNEQAFNNYYLHAETRYLEIYEEVQAFLNGDWKAYQEAVRALDLDPFRE
jgi:photosystem II stability/assembly factor-like uncharacterized protein